jgi:hypothetical protein
LPVAPSTQADKESGNGNRPDALKAKLRSRPRQQNLQLRSTFYSLYGLPGRLASPSNQGLGRSGWHRESFRGYCSSIVSGTLEIESEDCYSSLRAGIWTEVPRQR